MSQPEFPPNAIQIDEAWAQNVQGKSFEIWKYNGFAEQINQDVQLSQLGGLWVPVGREIYNHRQVRQIMVRRSLVNLAFGELGILTAHRDIISSATEAGREDLRVQLEAVPRQNPAWVLPLRAIGAFAPGTLLGPAETDSVGGEVR